MHQTAKTETNRRPGRFALVWAPLLALAALTAVTGCQEPDPSTGPALEKIEAKLDRIEVKLDTPSHSPIPPDNSRSIFVPDTPDETLRIVRQAAQALACVNPTGCTCLLDGGVAACSFVLACIDAGFCECVSGCENIG